MTLVTTVTNEQLFAAHTILISENLKKKGMQHPAEFTVGQMHARLCRLFNVRFSDAAVARAVQKNFKRTDRVCYYR